MEYKMKLDEPGLTMDNYHLILEPCEELIYGAFDKYLETHRDRSIQLADFGSCEGQTVLPFLKLVIGRIRRWSKSREIMVNFSDQHTNDFNALFRNVTAFQREMKDPLLRICITPGNVYEQCLPNDSIDLGICSFVVQWLSGPVHLDKDLIYIPGVTKMEEEIKRASAKDWRDFLLARSKEMKKGSVFLVNVPFGNAEVLSMITEEFVLLYERNIISQEDLCNTNISGNTFRTEADFRAPFKDGGQKLGVQLLHISKRPTKLYENNDIISGMRPWLYYSIVTGLSKTRNDREVQEICDIYFQNLQHRFSSWKCIELLIFDILFQKL